MNNEVRVSVIMPVYNSEEYLSVAVESILLQDFESFEILLIDDGSTDRSGTICDDFSARSSRVRAFHRENAGMCAARNFGISISNAQYVTFCDNDDEYLPGFLSSNYELARKYGADCVKCGRRLERFLLGEVEEKPIINVPDEMMVLRGEGIYGHYRELRINNAVWTGLYRREVIERNNICFDERLRHGNEDTLFNLQFYEHAQCIVLNPEVLYVWKQRLGHSSSMKLDMNHLTGTQLAGSEEAALMTRHGIRESNPRLYGERMSWYMVDVLAHVSRARTKDNWPETKMIYEELRNIYLLPAFNLNGISLGMPYSMYYRLLIGGHYQALDRLARLGVSAKQKMRQLGSGR
jgi:glycosyltransferase involved in cell wall biosynthesis